LFFIFGHICFLAETAMITIMSKFNWKAGLFCKCPKCGEGSLLEGLMNVRPRCAACGQNFSKFETADGPAFFAISGVGTVVGIAAGVYEVVAEPPVWVHFALWIPAILLGSLLVVRVSKGLMCAHQFALK
jgi:uncharacterized protein (DUF983 family)